MQDPEFVQHNMTHKILMDLEIQTNFKIPTKPQDQVII